MIEHVILEYGVHPMVLTAPSARSPDDQVDNGGERLPTLAITKQNLADISSLLDQQGDTLRVLVLSNVGLSEVPDGLPNGLETLDLSHNQIQSTVGLQRLPNLTTLRLNHNAIRSLLPAIVRGVSTLVASHNNIASFEGLQDLRTLTHLDVRFNQVCIKRHHQRVLL